MKPLFSMPKPAFTLKKLPKKDSGKNAKMPSAKKHKAADTADDDISQSSQDATPKRQKIIRTDVNVSKLAALPNGLAKVNVPTLLEWCKNNGVIANSKLKKDEVVKKIVEKLKFDQPEP